jgi:serine protease Do
MIYRMTGLLCLAGGLIALPGFAQTLAPQAPRPLTMRRTLNRGYLGVGVVELTDERVKALKLNDDRGVEVKRVDENSPAARVGLKENDVILEVNGKAIENMEQFQTTIGETQPGTKVNLTIWRDDGKQSLSATLVARPENAFVFGGPELPPNAPLPPMPPMPQIYGNGTYPVFPAESPRVGFEGEPLNGQLAEYFGVKEGVLVRSVTARTPADRAGLKAGDVVVKVNGTPVTSPREISGLLRGGVKKAVTFTVVRNKKEMTLKVEVAEDRQVSSEKEVL